MDDSQESRLTRSSLPRVAQRSLDWIGAVGSYSSSEARARRVFRRAQGESRKGAEHGKELLASGSPLSSSTRTGSDLEDLPDAADGGPAQDDLEQDAGATDD